MVATESADSVLIQTIVAAITTITVEVIMAIPVITVIQVMAAVHTNLMETMQLMVKANKEVIVQEYKAIVRPIVLIVVAIAIIATVTAIIAAVIQSATVRISLVLIRVLPARVVIHKAVASSKEASVLVSSRVATVTDQTVLTRSVKADTILMRNTARKSRLSIN